MPISACFWAKRREQSLSVIPGSTQNKITIVFAREERPNADDKCQHKATEIA